MKNKRLSILFASICLVLVMAVLPFMGACAKAPPGTTEIQILSMPVGTSAYVLSFGLADLTNKYSSWLRATCLETTALTENVQRLQADPAARKYTVAGSNPETQYQAEHAIEPFKTAYNSLMCMGKYGEMAGAVVTLNPNIKTPADLAGKMMAVLPKTTGATKSWIAVIDKGYGLEGKVRYEPMGLGDMASALVDGKVDFTWVTFNIIGKEYVPTPGFQTLLSAGKTFYFVPFSDASIKAAKDMWPWTAGLQLPIGTLGAFQKQAGTALRWPSGWYADEVMDERVVYEVMRIIDERNPDFATYHVSGKGLNLQTMADFAVPKDKWHKGALKYYKEKGITPGI